MYNLWVGSSNLENMIGVTSLRVIMWFEPIKILTKHEGLTIIVIVIVMVIMKQDRVL